MCVCVHSQNHARLTPLSGRISKLFGTNTHHDNTMCGVSDVGFEGWIRNVFSLIPDNCLSFQFSVSVKPNKTLL